MESEVVNEIYEAHIEEQEKEKKVETVQRSFTQSQLTWVVMAIIAFWYIVQIKQAVEFKTGAVMLAAVIFLIWMSNKGDQVPNEPLPDKVAKAILFKELEWKQRNTGEIPPGEIRVGTQCKLDYLQGKAWKWEIFFEVDKSEGGTLMYTAELHPFTGRIIAIKERPEGWTGREPRDIKFIPTREQMWERKYYGGGRRLPTSLPSTGNTDGGERI